MLEKAENVYLNQDHTGVIILDQSCLPNREVFLELKMPTELYRAIKELQVRGAPAIGIFAAYAIYILAKNQIKSSNYQEFLSEFRSYKDYLNSSRPTAVNLSWALTRMEEVVLALRGQEKDLIIQRLGQEAEKIQAEDIAMCRSISEYGLSLLKDGDGVITHCNAGPLATSLYGTALGPLILSKEQGMTIHVFVDETRPLLQGSRLTAYELKKHGVDLTLICDNMASIVMKSGRVNACFVGCDRVAANGDTANKIGTSGLAILAQYYGIPFYVLGPTSTVDLACPSGEAIEIEERDPKEIRSMWYKEPMAPDVNAYNPAFDVTDHELITAIVTEKGICRPSYGESLAALFD